MAKIKKSAAVKKKAPVKATQKAGTKETVTRVSVQPAKAPRTKSEILALMADTTGLTKRDVRALFDSLHDLVGKDLGSKGCGLFTIPGLMKIRRIHKPATKARKGLNPFTKEEQMFKAKPARNIVKVRPLKALKDMV